jgi:large subunit ribosomal protein L3
LSKPVIGHYAKANVPAGEKLVEFRLDGDAGAELASGAELKVDMFTAGQVVDVTGTTVGKGYAGAMKRWNFRGLEASHGVSVSHRSPGSTGNRQDPGRTFKGKKMAGNLGVERVTQQSLEIVSTDDDRGLIFIRGSVPGPKGGFVLVSDSKKHSRPKDAPFPAGLKTSAAPAAEAEAKKD